MDSFFNHTDKAAIDALLLNVERLKDEWWTGKDGVGWDTIKKDKDDNVV